MAQVLDNYLHQREERMAAKERHEGHEEEPCAKETEPSEPAAGAHVLPALDQPLLKIGDLCPECGQAAVVNEEGCRKCYACGYSEC